MRTTNRKAEEQHRIPIDPYISKNKAEELEATYKALKKKKPLLAKEVSSLAELGDFSENFEYQQAKRALRSLNNKLLKIERRLATAIIIAPEQYTVTEIGHTITIDVQGEHKTYTILGSSEIDPNKYIISYQSPIGSAILGKKVGEEGSFVRGGTDVSFTVVDIK